MLLVADPHGNSTIGLCPTEGIQLDDEGLYLPSKSQRWAWQCWQDVVAKAEVVSASCTTFMTWFMGDMVDRIGKGSQIVTYNDATIVKLGVRFVSDITHLSHSGVGIIRGTSAHVGDSAYLEEAIAQAVGAKPFPPDSPNASSWFAKLNLQGRIIWLAHHGRLGGMPHTKLNPLGNIAYAAIAEARKNGEAIPDVVCLAHAHGWGDTHDNFPVRVVQCPAWQLTTEYGNRIKPFQTLPIGATILTVTDGDIDIKMHLFHATPEVAWKPGSAKPKSLPISSTPSVAEQLI